MSVFYCPKHALIRRRELQYETISATVAVSQMHTHLSLVLNICVYQWVLYELAMNTEIQEKLRAEISLSPGDPSLDELNDQYAILNSVILETLRLHPAILENHHQVR